MSRVEFDPFQPKVDASAFTSGTTDWKDFYGCIKEEISPGMPEPLGKIAHIECFVDADCLETIRSEDGFKTNPLS